MKAIVQVFTFDVVSRVMVGLMNLMLIRFMPEHEFVTYTIAFALIAVVTETLSSSFNRIYIVGYQELGIRDFSASLLGFQLAIVTAVIFLGLPFQTLLNGTYGIVACVVLITCVFGFYRTIFQQKSDFIFFSLLELVKNILLILGLFALVYVQRYDLQAAPVLLIQVLATALVIALLCPRLIDMKGVFNFKKAIQIVEKIIGGRYKYLFSYFFVLAFFVQLDVLMLKVLADDGAVATYVSAFRYYSILLLLLGSVHTVLLPVIQQITTFAQWQAILKRLDKMFIAFLLTAIVAAWAAQWFIPWIDKGKYPNAVNAFRILVFSAIISMRCSPHVNLLINLSDFKFLFILVVGSVSIDVILNMALIPSRGAIGAAIAALVSFAVSTVIVYFRAGALAKTRFLT